MENHRKKTTLQPQSSINGGTGSGGGKALDIKLRKAEMNKVTVTVSQDGSADYTTISDAINSIPLHNTRRVILVIKPGVYRYAISIISPINYIFNSVNFTPSYFCGTCFCKYL